MQSIIGNKVFFRTTNPVVEFSAHYGTSAGLGIGRAAISVYCVTDKRFCMTSYCEGSLSPTAPQKEKIEGEIRRIANMSGQELDRFLNEKADYNPFADRKKRALCSRGDMKLRASINKNRFEDGLMSVGEKRTIAHAYERFVVARIFGGSAYARSRFSQNLYRVLMGPYGHIAHYDRFGFYEAQMRRIKDFKKNLQMVADSRTVFGLALGAHTAHVVDCDLVVVLSEIAKAYNSIQPVS